MSDNALFMEERRRTILDQLKGQGRVSVRDLSTLLKVSTVTIRQDLRALEEQQLLERTHGGAVLPMPRHNSPELSFELRLREHRQEKDALARYTASLVRSGDSIAMDASTTVFAMLPYLKLLDRLIIVTNSLVLAQACLDSPQIQVFMPGGRLRRDSISLVGKPDELPAINLNAGFFGAHGIAASTGLTESGMDEVNMKRGMMRRCLATYFVVDHNKWGKVAPYTLVELDSSHNIITTDKIPDEINQTVLATGAQIIRVSMAKA